MVFLALGAAVLAILVWAGRRPTRLAAPHRIIRALAAALAAAGAVVAGLRGAWIAALALIGLSGWLAVGLSPAPTRGGEMSLDQARSILGVASGAPPAEIEAAYRRLILRAHPDQGGSNGLAAQLNAARDRLLK